jgi:hypothetical protein
MLRLVTLPQCLEQHTLDCDLKPVPGACSGSAASSGRTTGWEHAANDDTAAACRLRAVLHANDQHAFMRPPTFVDRAIGSRPAEGSVKHG